MITVIRDSAIPSVVALGSTIGLPAVDGLHDAATWFASNGWLALSLQSQRMNGRLAPAVGVSGGNLFTLDSYECCSRVIVPNGYNSFALQASFKLNALGAIVSTAYGAVLRLEWLKGAQATPIQTYRFDNPAIVSAAGQFYALIVGKLPYKAMGSPHTMQELWLRVSVDLTDGNSSLIGVVPTPAQPTTFYQGLDYLQLHLFRDVNILF